LRRSRIQWWCKSAAICGRHREIRHGIPSVRRRIRSFAARVLISVFPIPDLGKQDFIYFSFLPQSTWFFAACVMAR
jgi:hypothetical protein